jgi:hypothetical protein
VLYGAEAWTLQKAEQKYLESFEMWWFRRMEKGSWTDCVRKEGALCRSQGGNKYSTRSKEKEGYLDWSHLAYELPSKTRYWRECRRDGKMQNEV